MKYGEISPISNISSSIVSADGFEPEDDVSKLLEVDETLDVSEVLQRDAEYKLKEELAQVYEDLHAVMQRAEESERLVRTRDQELEEAYNELEFMKFSARAPFTVSSSTQTAPKHARTNTTQTSVSTSHDINTQTSLMWDVDINSYRKKLTDANETILDMQWRIDTLTEQLDHIRTAPDKLQKIEQSHEKDTRALKAELVMVKERLSEVNSKTSWAMELADRVRKHFETEGGMQAVAHVIIDTLATHQHLQSFIAEVNDVVRYVRLAVDETGLDMSPHTKQYERLTPSPITSQIDEWDNFVRVVKTLTKPKSSPAHIMGSNRDVCSAAALLRRALKRSNALRCTLSRTMTHQDVMGCIADVAELTHSMESACVKLESIIDTVAAEKRPPSPLRSSRVLRSITPNRPSMSPRKPSLTNVRSPKPEVRATLQNTRSLPRGSPRFSIHTTEY
eukprot:TRINITY_DN36846_c0_g1_i1.p1 TRINITY_DN36846_c0_g1~~TRINITY_DN36846_c0_g1_i1.p1  ORF type:complete len:449 (+),score=104.55 TRINITY_DN36846_c0_g1_i1:47-1393(+)